MTIVGQRLPQKYEIVAGQRFGRGIVLHEVRLPPFGKQAALGRSGPRGARLLCDCGNVYEANLYKLRRGHTRSCGCLSREIGSRHLTALHADPVREAQLQDAQRISVTKHGLWNRHQSYRRWGAMLQRCYNPRHPSFEHYGARGIAVAEEWRRDAEAFCRWLDANLGPCPAGWSIDRIDNDGNYEPGNVRWANYSTQNANRRTA